MPFITSKNLLALRELHVRSICTSRYKRRAASCPRRRLRARSQSILLGEAAGVDSLALSALQDNLAQPDARMNRQWPASDVGHFEDLAVVHARRNETGRHMNHQSEAGE